MRISKSEREEQKTEAIETLRALLPAGSTVYTVLTNVSRSGMSRDIKCIVSLLESDDDDFVTGSHVKDISRLAARALGWSEGKNEWSVRVGGCGMDMGFHLVYSLSQILWPKGCPCIGEKCGSNDHSNGDRDRTVGHLHTDGGYCLNHKWL